MGVDLSRAQWRKSRHSGGGNQCVELARVEGVVAIRDSKNPDGDVIALPVAVATSLIGRLKSRV